MGIQTSRLKTRVKNLEYITIVWNTFEGAFAIIAGINALSLSLIGFGFSSGLEVFAGAVVLWELRAGDTRREKLALRMIGMGYFLVAVYILFNALKDLLQKHHAQASLFGIFLLFATVIIMFILAYLKTKAGKILGSKTVLAEANYSYIDGTLAAVVLFGLILNAVFGLWWIDQLMAIFIAIFALKEGVEKWREV